MNLTAAIETYLTDMQRRHATGATTAESSYYGPLEPLEVDDATLGLEAIKDVGPGGHFFGTSHTLERYETAFYGPMLSDWRNFETWSEGRAGRHEARQPDLDAAARRLRAPAAGPGDRRGAQRVRRPPHPRTRRPRGMSRHAAEG